MIYNYIKIMKGVTYVDSNQLKSNIQNFFQEGTVIVVGSGLSLAEGIPGMKELADELFNVLPNYLVDQDDKLIWDKIRSSILAGDGLEKALHVVKPSLFIEDKIRDITAKLIYRYDKIVLNDIICNHRKLRFSKFLEYFNIRNDGIVVITTNYDRLLEYACEYNELRIDTLFVGKCISSFQPNKNKFQFCEGIKKIGKTTKPIFSPKVKILKPHGCLSWHLIDDKVYSLPIEVDNTPLIITPGLNTYREGYNIPFDTHRNMSNEAIDGAQKFIIIGYGFNDDHLETHLMRQLEAGKPTFILSWGLSEKIRSYAMNHRNIIAICCDQKTNGSKIIFKKEETIMENVNMWDIVEMLKEVF